MATAAVQLDEEALVMHEIGQIKLPKGVTFTRLDRRNDWSGEPSFKIYFTVEQGIPPTKRRLRQLSALKDDVFERILPLDLGKWPYVTFLEAK